jgi:hypothetical protein
MKEESLEQCALPFAQKFSTSLVVRVAFHPSAFILHPSSFAFRLHPYLITPRFDVSMKRTSSSTSSTPVMSSRIFCRAWDVLSLEESNK